MEETKIMQKSAKRQQSPAAQEKKTAKATKDLTGNHPPPKRASTPWIFFNTEVAAKFRAEGKRKEAFTLSSEAWSASTEEQKAPYVKMAEEDQKRVTRQTEELKRLGYYKLDDGSKSTDIQNKHLLKVKVKKGQEQAW